MLVFLKIFRTLECFLNQKATFSTSVTLVWELRSSASGHFLADHFNHLRVLTALETVATPMGRWSKHTVSHRGVFLLNDIPTPSGVPHYPQLSVKGLIKPVLGLLLNAAQKWFISHGVECAEICVGRILRRSWPVFNVIKSLILNMISTVSADTYRFSYTSKL